MHPHTCTNSRTRCTRFLGHRIAFFWLSPWRVSAEAPALCWVTQVTRSGQLVCWGSDAATQGDATRGWEWGEQLQESLEASLRVTGGGRDHGTNFAAATFFKMFYGKFFVSQNIWVVENSSNEYIDTKKSCRAAI